MNTGCGCNHSFLSMFTQICEHYPLGQHMAWLNILDVYSCVHLALAVRNLSTVKK